MTSDTIYSETSNTTGSYTEYEVRIKIQNKNQNQNMNIY